MLATSVATLLVSSCGSGASPDSAALDPATAKGDRIASDFIQQKGAALDACFTPPPAIRGPGGIQTVGGEAEPAAAINRLVIAIDASGSMAARSGGETKMDAAKRAAIAFLRSVPANTEVGLVAFGHRGTNQPSGKAESCRAVETIRPLDASDPAAVEVALRAVRATGWTPLADAITAAGRSFTPSQATGAQVVYIVSDGLETCGGDPVAAARILNQGPVKAIVNIIGFDLTDADRAQLSAVASAGGGSFVEARSGGELSKAMGALWLKARSTSAMTTEYFDAGARIADNNRASGRYATDLNLCVAREASAETNGLQAAIDTAKATIPEGEAARTRLRERHEAYRTRSFKLAADLSAKATQANDAIGAQQSNSETRLGVKP